MQYARRLREAYANGNLYIGKIDIGPGHEDSVNLDSFDLKNIRTWFRQREALGDEASLGTHGTTTITETGCYLAASRPLNPYRINLCGALYPVTNPVSDGPDNLDLAFLAMTSPVYAGITISADRKLMYAPHAKKMGDSFQSFNYPVLAEMVNGEIQENPDGMLYQASMIDRWRNLINSEETGIRKEKGARNRYRSLRSDLAKLLKTGHSRAEIDALFLEYMNEIKGQNFDLHFPHALYTNVESRSAIVTTEGRTEYDIESDGESKDIIILVGKSEGLAPERLLPIARRWVKEGKYVALGSQTYTPVDATYDPALKAAESGVNLLLDMNPTMAWAKAIKLKAGLTAAGINPREHQKLLGELTYVNIINEVLVQDNEAHRKFLEDFGFSLFDDNEKAFGLLKEMSDASADASAALPDRSVTIYSPSDLIDLNTAAVSAVELIQDNITILPDISKKRVIKAAEYLLDNLPRKPIRNRRVLIVETNADFNYMTSRILESEGYTILSAYNCREGGEILLGERPDVVISDLWLPEGPGIPQLTPCGTTISILSRDILSRPAMLMVSEGVTPTDEEKNPDTVADVISKTSGFNKRLLKSLDNYFQKFPSLDQYTRNFKPD